MPDVFRRQAGLTTNPLTSRRSRSADVRLCAKLKTLHPGGLETMPTDEHLAKHDSQISRLEQVMTALAEAQVKTEAQMTQLSHTMKALAEAQVKTETEVSKLSAETRALERQWQAYLNTLPKN